MARRNLRTVALLLGCGALASLGVSPSLHAQPAGTAPPIPALRGAAPDGTIAPTAAPALPPNPIPQPSVVPAAPSLPTALAPTEAAPAPAPAAPVPPPAEPAHAAAAAPAPTEAAAATAGDIATAPVPPFAGAAMHAGAHGESAEHGGEPAGPVIENWWSWDYGPGKSHHHPPFGFALLNFAIFLLLMNKLFGKSFRDFLQNRHSDVRRAIDRAREVQQQAEQQLQQIEDRARNLEAEIAELLASFRKQAEAERQAIVLRAENEAAGLLRDAESQAQAAIASAKQALEQKAALLAVDLAEKLIRSRIQESDQRRLSDEYLRELEGLASRTAAPPVAAVANKEAP